MSLKNIIDKDIKESMFQKNKNRLIALRAIKAAILLEEKSSSSNNFNENQLFMFSCLMIFTVSSIPGDRARPTISMGICKRNTRVSGPDGHFHAEKYAFNEHHKKPLNSA